MTVAAGVVLGAEGAEALLRDVLAAALGVNRRLAEMAGALREGNARLREENARLAERDAEQAAELDRMRADLAVLQRLLFGWSRSGRVRGRVPVMTGLAAGSGGAALAGAGRRKRGPGARVGRRDYSHLPRFKVVWDFPGGGYCCPGCGERFTLLGGHITELLDWVVIVRVAAHCRRRYRRACGCRVPAAVMAPGPPRAIGKGLFTNAFTAMLLTERYAAGRSMNSLVAGLARRGAGISPATLAGTCAQAGALLAPAADAITERSRGSWHLHAGETTWRVFPPREGGGPAKWWLWVLLGPGTCCFVMDPTRSGAVLARHAGIDGETGQLTPDEDGGPRRLVISSDFCTVYEPAGKKADGWAQPPQQPG